MTAALIAAHIFMGSPSRRLARPQHDPRVAIAAREQPHTTAEAHQESISVAANIGPMGDSDPTVLQAGGDNAILPPSLLPDRSDAVPLDAAAPFLEMPVTTIIAPEADQEFAPSKSSPQKPKPRDSAARRLIERELGDSSAEDREVWHETLKDSAPNDLGNCSACDNNWADCRRFFRKPWRRPRRDLRCPTPGFWMATPGESSTRPAPVQVGPAHDRAVTAGAARARRTLLRNIANLQSVGYKREIVLFENLVDNLPPKSGELASAKVGGAVPGTPSGNVVSGRCQSGTPADGTTARRGCRWAGLSYGARPQVSSKSVIRAADG